MAALPPELLHKICLNVPVAQLGALRSTCRALRSAVQDGPFQARYYAQLKRSEAEAKAQAQAKAEAAIQAWIQAKRAQEGATNEIRGLRAVLQNLKQQEAQLNEALQRCYATKPVDDAELQAQAEAAGQATLRALSANLQEQLRQHRVMWSRTKVSQDHTSQAIDRRDVATHRRSKQPNSPSGASSSSSPSLRRPNPRPAQRPSASWAGARSNETAPFVSSCTSVCCGTARREIAAPCAQHPHPPPVLLPQALRIGRISAVSLKRQILRRRPYGVPSPACGSSGLAKFFEDRRRANGLLCAAYEQLPRHPPRF